MQNNQLESNTANQQGKVEVTVDPRSWVRMLNGNSKWAKQFLDELIKNNTIEKLLNNTDSFNAWIKYITDFNVPLDDAKKNCSDLFYYRTSNRSSSGGYIHSYMFVTNNVFFNEDLYSSNDFRVRIISDDNFKNAYDIEQTRANLFADTLLQLLNAKNNPLLKLDHAFTRVSTLMGSGAPSKSLQGLLNVGKYTLMLAIFKRLSPIVAITELFISSEFMGAQSVLDQLINRLPHAEARSALSQMITHITGEENEQAIQWWYSKIPRPVLNQFQNKSPSLAARLSALASPIASSDSKNIELTSPPTTYGDDMPLDEVIEGKNVIYPEVTHELNQNSIKLADIYTENASLGISYAQQMREGPLKYFMQTNSISVQLYTTMITALLSGESTYLFGCKLLSFALPETQQAVFRQMMNNENSEQLPAAVLTALMNVVTADNADTLIPSILNKSTSFLAGPVISPSLRALIIMRANTDFVNRNPTILADYINAINLDQPRQDTVKKVLEMITPITWQKLCGKESNEKQLTPILDAMAPDSVANLLTHDTMFLETLCTNGHYTSAVALYLKAPQLFRGTNTGSLPASIQTLIQQTYDKLNNARTAHSADDFRNIGASPELMKFIISVEKEHHEADAYLQMVRNNPVKARQFTALYTEEQIDALVASAATLKIDHFFENLIDAFKNEMPLALLNKASIVTPFDFSLFDAKADTIPYVATAITYYEQHFGSHKLLMNAFIQRLSPGDLLALVATVFKRQNPLQTELALFSFTELTNATFKCNVKNVFPIFAMQALPHLLTNTSMYRHHIISLLNDIKKMPDCDKWMQVFMTKHANVVYPLATLDPAIAKMIYDLSPQVFGSPNIALDPDALMFVTYMQVKLSAAEKATNSAVGTRNTMLLSRKIVDNTKTNNSLKNTN